MSGSDLRGPESLFEDGHLGAANSTEFAHAILSGPLSQDDEAIAEAARGLAERILASPGDNPAGTDL